MISLRRLPKPNSANLAVMTKIATLGSSARIPFYQDLQIEPPVYNLKIIIGAKASTPREFQSARITCDLGIVTLFYQVTLIEYLCDISLPGWREEDAEALPWDICVAYVLSRVCDLADIGAGFAEVSDVTLSNSVPESSTACVVWAGVRVGDVTHHLAMQIHDCNSARVAHAFRADPDRPQQRRSDPSFRFYLGIASPKLTMSQLRNVTAGTILTAGQLGPRGCPVVGRIPGIMQMTGHLDAENNLTLVDVHKGAVEMQDEEQEPNQEADEAKKRTNAVLDADEIDGLPITLDLAFPTQRISLKNLTKIGVGASFPVGSSLTDSLTIRANGQSVGMGRLINLDGVLGLQVTEWTLKTDTGSGID